MAKISITPVRFGVEDDLILTDEKLVELEEFKRKYEWLSECNLLLVEKGADDDGPLFLTIRKDEETFLPEDHDVFKADSSGAREAYRTLLLADGRFPDGASAGGEVQLWSINFIRDLIELFDREFPVTAALDVGHASGERIRYTWSAALDDSDSVRVSWEIDED